MPEKVQCLISLQKEYQAYVMKADEVGHLVMEPGQECYEPVIALFGKQIIKDDKTIDRRQVIGCSIFTSGYAGKTK